MGAKYLFPRLPELPVGILNFNTNGDNTVISAIAGNRITVHGLWLVADAATVLIFKDANTPLSGPISLSAHQEIHLELRGEPWFTMSPSSPFVINSSNAVQVGGILNYNTNPALANVSGDILAEDGSFIVMEDGTRIAVEN